MNSKCSFLGTWAQLRNNSALYNLHMVMTTFFTSSNSIWRLPGWVETEVQLYYPKCQKLTQNHSIPIRNTYDYWFWPWKPSYSFHWTLPRGYCYSNFYLGCRDKYVISNLLEMISYSHILFWEFFILLILHFYMRNWGMLSDYTWSIFDY